MNTRIRWTEEERNQVIQKAVELYHRGNASHLDALRLAQNVTLHGARIRSFATHSAAKIEIRLLKEAYSKWLQTSFKREANVSTIPEVSVPPAPSNNILPVLGSISTEDLIGEIAKRIADKLATAIQHEVKELEHNFKLQKHDPTYASKGLFKKRITIIGLLNDQVHSIQTEFGDRLAIKCICTDRAMGMNPPDADAYLLIKNFINHPLYHKYKGFPNHVLIDGGMSTLRMWLNTKGAEL
jgi:hypothetical protein